MKFLPRIDREKLEARRADYESSPGHGLDAVIVLVLFVGVGFGLDSAFGTVPVFMIVMAVLAAVGLFARFKYRYDLKMEEHEAKRREAAASRTAGRVTGSGATARPATGTGSDEKSVGAA